MKTSKTRIIAVLSAIVSVLMIFTMMSFAYTTNSVSDASATVYSTSGGSTSIGSIGPDENLDAGSVANGRTYVTYRTSGADKSGWVSSGAVRMTDWRWPVECVNRTQDFGDYSSSRGGYHLGIDMTSLIGDLGIRAPSKSNVKYRGYSSGNGYHVILQDLDSDGVTVYSLYSHLASIDPDITTGAEITKGTHLGTMGTSGSSTGVHLHLSFMNKYYSSDPYGYTSSGGSIVSRDTFKIVMNYSGNQVTYFHPQYVIRNGGDTP